MKTIRALLALSALLAFPTIANAITFAQLAMGGGYEATLFITNKTSFNWTGELKIYQGNNQKWAGPWSVDGKDYTGMSGFPLNLGLKATQKMVFRGDAITRRGYLAINSTGTSSSSEILIGYFYNYYSGGSLRDSVGSIPSAMGNKFMLPAELNSSIDTGLAWCYDASYTITPFSIRLTAFDENVKEVTSEVITWDGHGARFISQYLPKLTSPSLDISWWNRSDTFTLRYAQGFHFAILGAS